MKKLIIDGNEAVSKIAYLFTDLASIYPITPSSPMAEHIEKMESKGEKNFFNNSVKVVEMQSEAGAAGVLHGALQAGSLATTFTASQGLLLMIPNMYKIAGELLPCVIHVAARSLSTHALSILGDHQDIYATRMTGFNMLSSSSVESASDMAAISHLSAIKLSMPFMNFFDGFRTSHELTNANILEASDLKDLIDYEALDNFRNKSILGNRPFTVGTNQNDDVYFQAMEAKNVIYNKVPDIVNDYMTKINIIKGTNYKPFNYYGSSVATNVIVAMGSVCETIRQTVDKLNNQGYKVGLVEVHLYRPFSSKYLNQVLPLTTKKIAVLDRTKENGSVGEPLYLDVKGVVNSNIEVYGGRYGLSSKDTTPAMIKAVYDFLDNKPSHDFTIGINDDVTHLSLSYDKNFTIDNGRELLIYGYGSDGMVSASKTIIKILGNTNYVQGYFQYDSKKSGGVTISHIRLDNKNIHATYYVRNPEYIIISKDRYLTDFDCLSNIRRNGKILINTDKTSDEINKLINENTKKMLKERNVDIYLINSYELSYKNNLKDKISMIMANAILMLLGKENDNDKLLEKYIKERFYAKGEEVVKSNIEAIKEANGYMKKLKLTLNEEDEILNVNSNSLLTMIEKREGNNLPVSSFVECNDGRFYYENKKLDKKAISKIVPNWISSNCINCNQCSFVCPHSVIRPVLLSEEEYQKAPDYVKNRAVKPLGNDLSDYYFMITISIKNCTGCGLCIKTCPTLNKALVDMKIDEAIRNKEQEIFDYVDKYITEKEVSNKYTVKGSQFKKPKFEFCGACSGCGETAYIKLLTQLLGDQLVVANATGCSSIYGGSIPDLPYKISWASSLFEDNAEYGYGMVLANTLKQDKVAKVIEKEIEYDKEILTKWLDNRHNIDITREVYNVLKDKKLPVALKNVLEDIKTKSIWCIGGDGWAYDIGYSGIDHVLASKDNINILVLDTEVYSNTGGQSSKASPRGSVASFTTSGKKRAKKDLAAIALMYPNAYVAQVCLAGNKEQVVRVMKEAINYNGPSIIIAYTPCISHGIKGGMANSLESEKLAVKCGYFPIFHRNPENSKFILDFKNVDFDLYESYLDSQLRYRMLKTVNEKSAKELLEANKQDAIRRFNYYKDLENK